MHLAQPKNLRLSTRSEGKIKSYGSCSDLRAWSHDVVTKDSHLRDWMRSSMPLYVIPVSTLTGFLNTMTCRSRRRVTPRCHRDCKSKMLVESICSSCHAIRGCLEEKDYEKYFVEEELETSQWPCYTCLDALKNIKMFWKIFVDKIFQVNISKYDDISNLKSNCCSKNSVISVAKTWQSEIVSQALYVKGEMQKSEKCDESSQRTAKSLPVDELYNYEKKTRQAAIARLHKFNEEKNLRRIHKKLNRGTCTSAKYTSKGCTCSITTDLEDIKAYRTNVEVLQTKCNDHFQEVERLKTENTSLRIELENVYKSCPWKAAFYGSEGHRRRSRCQSMLFKTEDRCPEPAKNLDSEMIITMKQCKNKDFKNVSLLQVLHKTNDPFIEQSRSGPACKKKDPIHILTKVHDIFGEMVKRELDIANEQRHLKKQPSDMEATFHSINSSRSTPSTIISRLSSKSEPLHNVCRPQNQSSSPEA